MANPEIAGELILLPDKDKSMLRHHPWIFSGAISTVKGKPGLGQTVTIVSAKGDTLALAAYSPHSQIRARVWSFDPLTPIDEAWFHRRLSAAIALRRPGANAPDAAARLVFSESDGLPGLIVDQYADTLVCQFLSAGADYHRETITSLLGEIVNPRRICERSDTDARSKEGLPFRTGTLLGEPPADAVRYCEHGIILEADIMSGHKTGQYLDQSENRAAIREFSADADVLNCFCYTGGFTLHALAGGAKHVVQADASAEALTLADHLVALNGFDPARVLSVKADVFQLLRQYNRDNRRFDVIILDPPKFVESRKTLDSGARGYKDINRLGMSLLKPGGTLVTFTCSGLMPSDLFRKIVADAALDAKRGAKVVRRLFQAPDHPVLLSFPEAEYLRGLVCVVE